MPYEVASGGNLFDLAEKVEEMRKQGYTLQGGVAVTAFFDQNVVSGGAIRYSFYQAMVKEPEADLSRAVSKE